MNDLIDRLEDGTACQIGLCLLDGKNEDRACVKAKIDEAVQRMSPKSRRQRFAAPLSRLSDAQLDYLTELDGHDRLAWCAFDATDGEDEGIALARYVRLPDEPNVAEFAVTVVDAFQRRGLGTLLLRRLIDSAGEREIQILRGYALPDNEAMQRLARRFNASRSREDAFVRLEIQM